jgi:hypothetical protein
MSAQFDALGIIQSFQTATAPAIDAATESVAPSAATVAATAAEGGLPPSSAASNGATAGQTAKHAAPLGAGRATTVAATSASEGGIPPSSAASDGATAGQAPTHAAISTRAIFRSDWPARPLDPRITLAAAVAAEPETSATERAAWLAGAIDAYTARAAYASFDETRKGTIAKDMLADFVIFTADLFAPKQDTPIADAAITATVVNGRIVFNATQTKPAPALSTAP